MPTGQMDLGLIKIWYLKTTLSKLVTEEVAAQWPLTWISCKLGGREGAAAGHVGRHQSRRSSWQTPSFWWQQGPELAVRVSHLQSLNQNIEGRCAKNWWCGGRVSVPVPCRAEAIVGPPSLRGMYTVAKGPTALLQKTRRGELICQKMLWRVAKKGWKGCLIALDWCRIAMAVLSVATKVG